MLSSGIKSSASQELYTQFFYRILRLSELFGNIYLCMFSKGNIFSAGSFKAFREYSDSLLTYCNGIAFKASEFADCSGAWGVYLSLWKPFSGVNSNYICNFDICTVDMGIVKHIRNKTLYLINNTKSLSSWYKVEGKVYDAPQMTSALSWRMVHNSGNLVKGALGYFVNAGNNVQQSQQLVLLLSSCFNTGHGVSIVFENFKQICVAFTVRRLITGIYATWINDKDEYMIPNTKHSDYVQFETDSLVYCLFNNASNQSSLRSIEYNGKQWDIKNEFFWLSRQEMWQLAIGSECSDDINNEVEQDLYDNADDERYVYKELQKVTLSPDAMAVLDKATELIHKSFKYRRTVGEQHPEYHLNTWDMGYYQLNKLIQEIPSLSAEWKEFRALYKTFEDRMRPLVYELGFLYK